jgi:oxygen-dependent protoporphyrinogen oxidase
MKRFRVVVLGGGITGLAAAYRCRELAAEQTIDAEITVLERSSRVGGCVETHHDGDYVLEFGPDSIVAEKPAAIDLARRLGVAEQIQSMRPEYRGARILRGSRLVPIPPEFRLFAPTSLAALVTSGLLSAKGIARAAIEPLIPPRRSAGDESLASFVTRRFGREVLERLAQPLIGGIYSGDPQQLSMQATMPQFLEAERKYGSVVRGMRARSGSGATKPGFNLVSMRSGLGTITSALELSLRDAIRTSSDIVGLRRFVDENGGAVWKIVLADGTEIEADAVINALPAQVGADLIEDIDADLAAMLRSIRYHSVATITMAYALRDIPQLPRCTGFVVPHVEGRKIRATTFTSQKYTNRSPEGFTVLRAFAGGALQSAVLNATDEDLIGMVRAEFQALLGIVAEPRFSIVRRWTGALPEYRVGHVDLVDRIERRAATLGGFVLAGAAYRGAGIPDCVRSGEGAATAVFTEGLGAYRQSQALT